MKTLCTIASIIGLALATLAACDDERPGDPEYCDFYCPPGSSFPCPCNAVDGCNDGSSCSGVSEDHTLGFCARSCTANADCEADIPCNGVAQCVLTTSEGMACAYVCEGDWDCPNNMACIEAGNGRLCYPEEQPDAGTGG
jgi:hypothetical protein